MTVLKTTRTNGFFFNLLMNIERAMEKRRAYRQTVRELSSLSERELLDLNLSRADIDRVARQAVANH